MKWIGMLCLWVGIVTTNSEGAINSKWDITTLPQPDIKTFSSNKGTDVDAYHRAVLDFIYPHIVNTNIGFARLRQTIESSSRFGSVMVMLCRENGLTCTSDNYKNKLSQAITLIYPSEVMAHLIERTEWGKGYYASRGNNWFNLLCHREDCGFELKQSAETGDYIKSYENPVKGLYDMMDTMLKERDLRIVNGHDWKVAQIVNSDRVVQYRHSFDDFMRVSARYDLHAYDNAMFEYFETLPLWSWPQLSQYHNREGGGFYASQK